MVANYSLGGGMVWAIDGDDFRNDCGFGHFPLMHAIYETINGGPPPTTTVTLYTNILLQKYINNSGFDFW